ncbi:MAG: hypothetical protein HKO62_03945 [Gammaproteobacteria bacterium]|nr:ABC transporter substrate-binding protein [Gammaproteobacteria bacterium]NNL99879.1 hypothetical protein [Gammaproteobacteria bacterium]
MIDFVTNYRRFLKFAASAAGVLLLACAARADDQADAAQVVETLHDTLLAAMQQADDLGFSGRRELIGPVLDESFDFQTIARIVLGRYRRDISAEEQAQFQDAFTRLSSATYASRFSGYDGERFETGAVEPQRSTLLVKTLLLPADDEPVHLDYVLRSTDDGWRIINVIAEGVSDLSLKRAEYTAVIKTDGFAALLEVLDDKIARIENPGE